GETRTGVADLDSSVLRDPSDNANCLLDATHDFLGYAAVTLPEPRFVDRPHVGQHHLRGLCQTSIGRFDQSLEGINLASLLAGDCRDQNDWTVIVDDV